MFFDQASDINKIAPKVSCSIFVVPPDTPLTFKNSITLHPDESKTTTVITVEQIRDFLALTSSIETRDHFFVITPADAMNEAAQNAFLKTFEEPKPFCHFVLLTEQPNLLLPTIRSRAQTFYLKQTNTLNAAPTASPKVLAAAKQLISTQPAQLPTIAADLAKAKPQPRQQALAVVGTAIELLYKSYLKTNNPKFLTKLPDFLQLYDNLNNNCHIKLHIVADLS